jgi:DNA-binding transcriptional regulator YiaG
MSKPANVNEAVRSVRVKLGLTQQEMADRLGVHLRTLQQWEYARRRPCASAQKLLDMLANGDIPAV